MHIYLQRKLHFLTSKIKCWDNLSLRLKSSFSSTISIDSVLIPTFASDRYFTIALPFLAIRMRNTDKLAEKVSEKNRKKDIISPSKQI